MFRVFNSVLLVFCICDSTWGSTDDLDNHICPEDMEKFRKFFDSLPETRSLLPIDDDDYEDLEGEDRMLAVPDKVDCFGLGALTRKLPFIFNMEPDTSEQVNTHFFFSSRKKPSRAQVFPGDKFNLESVDFDPKRNTVMIIHGFMSFSNAEWVTDMTKALLTWGDVNVITVDWGGGGNTWRYWKAVANTRRVGADVTAFLNELSKATGVKPKDFHLVGHSLGAHICAYVAYELGGVHRITGLDPAQPCFITSQTKEKLDKSDADFVDVVHTNGRLLTKIGFGLPDPSGGADFYPNGGMKQPGCSSKTKSIVTKVLGRISPEKLQQAICSHGRAYLLFTESLVNKNCLFRGHRWNLTYEGLNASMKVACNRKASCPVMGVQAIGGGGLPRASGSYFVVTTDKEPYCPTTEWERRHPRQELLKDLQKGFVIDRTQKSRPKTKN